MSPDKRHLNQVITGPNYNAGRLGGANGRDNAEQFAQLSPRLVVIHHQAAAKTGAHMKPMDIQPRSSNTAYVVSRWSMLPLHIRETIISLVDAGLREHDAQRTDDCHPQ